MLYMLSPGWVRQLAILHVDVQSIKRDSSVFFIYSEESYIALSQSVTFTEFLHCDHSQSSHPTFRRIQVAEYQIKRAPRPTEPDILIYKPKYKHGALLELALCKNTDNFIYIMRLYRIHRWLWKIKSYLEETNSLNLCRKTMHICPQLWVLQL